MRQSLAFASMALWLTLVQGCGGGADTGGGAVPSSTTNERAPSRVHLVGFDVSEPLLNALRSRKLSGVIVQDPFAMGELGVKTLVDHLEGKKVEASCDTGETLVTPDNLNDPKVATLLKPPKTANANDSPSGAKKKKWKLFVIPKGTTHEFWQTIHAGALKAANDLGNVEIVWQGPEKEDDRVQQIQLVQTAAASGVDGIVLAPLDSKALVKPVEEAIAKNIPVVIIDSGLESKKPISHIATNNFNGGVMAARRLGELLNGEGKIILLRYAVGSESTEQRERGFTETIAKEFPNITYLSKMEYAGATPDSAQQKSQSLISQFRGKLNGVFCPNESSTLGMLRALDAAGMLSGGP